jgi:hypothetical protein
MHCPNCPYCVGNGCPRCDYTGVLGGDDKLPIAPYPQPYDAQQQLMTDWTFAYPVERPEMLIWGSSLVVAAFMVAAPRVAAGFGEVTDAVYLREEEKFQNAAYNYDQALRNLDVAAMRRSLKRMKKAWDAVERDRAWKAQYTMRLKTYKQNTSGGRSPLDP